VSTGTCICRASESQVDVRAQELEIVAYRFGDLAVDSLQGLQRILRLVFLEMDARETERGFIADDARRRSLPAPP
jgi:hypothetical protein